MSAYNTRYGRQSGNEHPTTTISNDRGDSAQGPVHRRHTTEPVLNAASGRASAHQDTIEVAVPANDNAEGSQSLLSNPPSELESSEDEAEPTATTARTIDWKNMAEQGERLSKDNERLAKKIRKMKSSLEDKNNVQSAKAEADKTIAYLQTRIKALELRNARLEEAHEENEGRLLQAERKEKELGSLKRQFDKVQTDIAEIEERFARARRDWNGVNTHKSPRNQEEESED
ncbi:hypothetical protein NX059_000801 [Plenodomus lindquistii]|nr:hypothetical protein NX059_000801 [Plenodomus lindquistii]